MSKQTEKPTCEQLIDIVPQPFVVIDRDYRILAANKAYREHYQSQHRDVIGCFCHEVSHHSDVPCSQHGEHCPLEAVFETGQEVQVMHIHYDHNGQEEYVQLQAKPIFGLEGEVLFMGETINPVMQPGDDNSVVIGRSPAMLRLLSLLQRVAPTNTTVFLQGESGVGKERAAEYIHQYSSRARGPFVVVDCGAMGESLIETELFGHERGAFTGATGRKKGLFEAAHGGTLLIDEICELPLHLQTNLLRALESGTIRRVGGTEYIDVDVRVIAASNRNVQEMVARGEFRQDLYYRLSAFPVTIPPLRERKDDIRVLAEHFLCNHPDGRRFVPLSAEMIEALMGYDYPGNVRELRNIIERASIIALGSVLRPDHLVFEVTDVVPSLPQAATAHGPARSLMPSRARLSDEKVLDALESCGGHRAQAATLLGVSERTLYRHVRKLRQQQSETTKHH